MEDAEMGSYYNESADYEYLPGLFSSLTEVLEENRQYYSRVNDSSKSKEFSKCFDDLVEVTEKTLKLLLEVAAVSPLFDYDHNTKGNGYRTIVKVVELCFRRLHALGEDFQNNRAGFLFRSDHYYKEIVSYLDLSKGLFKFLEFAKLLLEWSHGNDLFPPENCYDAKTMTDSHLHEMEKECFYGRRLGFHFNTALRGFLTAVCISMASFGDGYAKHDGSFTVAAASLLNGPKYLINPDLRAKRLISLSTLVDMEFCKAFWSLTERYGFQHFPVVVSAALKVNEFFEIPPIPIDMSTETGDKVTIQPPASWIGPAPVKVHLLSYLLRAGQSCDKDGNLQYNPHAKPKADGLIIHIHGGGFVAQSSKSHEIYLRSWAKSLNVPILSINYALAPELPFPRAMEECFFAYAWALKNLHKLGTTGRHIALVGDSAGGNLCVTLCLKAASYGIHLPDGILTSYAPFNVQFRPSPSRLLSLLDPLLPIGILTRCLAAYTGTTEKDDESVSEIRQTGAKRTSKTPGCYCEDDNMLPDVVQESQSSSARQVSHASSEFDLVHAQMDHVCRARSQSDSDVPHSSNAGTEENKLHDVSSCRLLNDEHLITMAKNPFISPLVASNEQLAKLPPIDLLACTMDPLLDDSIEFAKRLRNVGNNVELYIVDDLPHGFLSFYMICQEGREANELCIACIKKILLGKRNVTELSTPPIY